MCSLTRLSFTHKNFDLPVHHFLFLAKDDSLLIGLRHPEAHKPERFWLMFQTEAIMHLGTERELEVWTEPHNHCFTWKPGNTAKVRLFM